MSTAPTSHSAKRRPPRHPPCPRPARNAVERARAETSARSSGRPGPTTPPSRQAGAATPHRSTTSPSATTSPASDSPRAEPGQPRPAGGGQRCRRGAGRCRRCRSRPDSVPANTCPSAVSTRNRTHAAAGRAGARRTAAIARLRIRRIDRAGRLVSGRAPRARGRAKCASTVRRTPCAARAGVPARAAPDAASAADDTGRGGGDRHGRQRRARTPRGSRPPAPYQARPPGGRSRGIIPPRRGCRRGTGAPLRARASSTSSGSGQRSTTSRPCGRRGATTGSARPARLISMHRTPAGVRRPGPGSRTGPPETTLTARTRPPRS